MYLPRAGCIGPGSSVWRSVGAGRRTHRAGCVSPDPLVGTSCPERQEIEGSSAGRSFGAASVPTRAACPLIVLDLGPDHRRTGYGQVREAAWVASTSRSALVGHPAIHRVHLTVGAACGAHMPHPLRAVSLRPADHSTRCGLLRVVRPHSATLVTQADGAHRLQHPPVGRIVSNMSPQHHVDRIEPQDWDAARVSGTS